MSRLREPLYYSIRKSWGNQIVAVTSEKPSRWFGRRLPYNDTTHGRTDDLMGKFKSEQDARACKAGIEAIDKVSDEKIRELNRLITNLRRETGRAIDRYIEDFMEGKEDGSSTCSRRFGGDD